MADISDELNTIENERNGEPVLTAISSAMTAINSDADIASELYTITNGRYGSDIRMAIHDALYKLSENGGGGGSESLSIGNPYGLLEFCDTHTTGNAIRYYSRPTLVLHCRDVRGPSKSYIQFAELNFYDSEGNLIDLSDYNPTITGSKPELATGESVDKSIDGDPNTKYFTSLDSSAGLTVTIELDYTGTFGYFSYTTGFDAQERDPTTFTIDSYRGTTVTRIIDVSNAEITTTRMAETQLFPCNS